MRLALRRGFRLLAVTLLASGVLTPAASSYAQDPVGGPALGSTGVVYDRKPGSPPPPPVTAAGWLVADLDTGAVLAARNPHGKFLPASTLKTLTAIALLPRLDPATKVKPSNDAAAIDGTKVGIKPGFPVTVDLLFTGMLIYSGNDTATALSDAAGGQATTVRIMNEQAKRLQAGDTLAVNPTGLDAENQVSSPYDLALMGRAALKIDAYRRYTAIKGVQVPSPTGSFQIANKNRLLFTYAGTFGGKTGGTTKALQTYIGYAARGGRRLVVTIMKTHQWRTEAPQLLDWGFAVDGLAAPVGELVPPLDEITARAAAAPRAPVASPTSQGAPSSSAAQSGGPATGTFPAPGAGHRRSTFASMQRLGSHLHWWYAAGPVGFAGAIAIAMALRRRRRRRRGFYLPQTKLRLPVR